MKASWWIAALLAGQSLWAASSPEAIPKLLPPRGEIPPGVWEQHGVLIVLLGALGVVLLAAGLWLLLRRHPAPPPPPEIVARQELALLRSAPETGVVLSRASQVVRRYLGSILGLAPVEMTTAEFCQALGGNAQAGPELAGRVSQFLRDCDRIKFAPAGAGAPTGMLAQAEALVTLGEQRQTELRRAAGAAAAPASGKARP